MADHPRTPRIHPARQPDLAEQVGAAGDPAMWSVHVGEVGFDISAPAQWTPTQCDYLSHYLTGPLNTGELARFSLRVHLLASDDGARAPFLESVLDRARPVRQLCPIPGVRMLETLEGSGWRRYEVIGDELERRPGAFAARARDGELELFIPEGADKAHSYPLRLIREAMMRTHENHGGVIVHAAGCDVAGLGVMICGPRSAGKTTTLTALLSATAGGLLSNDRIILDPGGQRMLSVPLPVPIARGTIDANPRLRHAMAGLSRPQPALHTLPRQFGTSVKAEFSAREYATALGGHLSPAARLGLIIVPRLADTDEPARLRRLPEAGTRAHLQRSCFTPLDEFWREPWLVPRTRTPETLTRAAHALLDRLAQTVPAVEVSFGVRNPADHLARALTTIIDGALAERAGSPPPTATATADSWSAIFEGGTGAGAAPCETDMPR